MSALHLKADIEQAAADVRYGPLSAARTRSKSS
jgi:hypothetical protein